MGGINVGSPRGSNTEGAALGEGVAVCFSPRLVMIERSTSTHTNAVSCSADQEQALFPAQKPLLMRMEEAFPNTVHMASVVPTQVPPSCLINSHIIEISDH